MIMGLEDTKGVVVSNGSSGCSAVALAGVSTVDEILPGDTGVRPTMNAAGNASLACNDCKHQDNDTVGTSSRIGIFGGAET